MNKPKLILFDIGGVLIEYGNVFKTASIELNIPHTLIDSTFNKYDTEITTGVITPQELYLKCLSNNKIDANRNYNFMLSWIKDYTSIKPTYNLLVELSSKYEVGLFSNIYKGMIPELIKQDLIPNINYAYRFISCDMGLQKPDITAYKVIMSTVNYPANELFFIDDRQENINIANNLGWGTYLFSRENPIESVKELRMFLL